jgi:GT2 family glycosyltransferase
VPESQVASLTKSFDGGIDLLTGDAASAAEIGTFVRRTLAPLDAATRSSALEFFASALNAVPEAERAGLSERLFEIREALRERLPLTPASHSDQRGIHVDRIMAVDERSFYIEGWLHDPEVARLTAVSPEGSRHELLDRLFRHARPDVAETLSIGTEKITEPPGFVCYFELDGPSLRADGWLLEIETQRGIASEIQLPPVLTDQDDVIHRVLHNPYITGAPNDELMSSHVSPAISRIREQIGAAPKVKSVAQFGTRPETAEISIVVPLYLQIQHLEIQLAQFANDPELYEVDLIYVLDSPQQEEEALGFAAELFPIYRVPFRVAVLERNTGFAGANNAGVGLASGRLALLLNSDVLPEQPGWLGTMQRFYDATSKIGALGPKLLYEDNSIQHAGMYFHQLAGSSKWVDGHYFKGMHRSLPAANVARPVPVVSGSCLMIDRALYERLGGLSGAYVQGDYEDSDLCLKLWQEGLENWYLPEAELYHLEGQSYADDMRQPANRYNMWLHNHLWSERIAERMKQQEAAEKKTTRPSSGNL